MLALIQRVSEARVTVDGRTVGQISRGLLIFVGVRQGDSDHEATQLSNKILKLRIFPDISGKMNLDVSQIGGEILVVSQFTLYAETAKGTRPSFSLAAPAEQAKPLYELLIARLRQSGIRVSTGVFQAHMKVDLTNDGPVTLLCRSENVLQFEN